MVTKLGMVGNVEINHAINCGIKHWDKHILDCFQIALKLQSWLNSMYLHSLYIIVPTNKGLFLIICSVYQPHITQLYSVQYPSILCLLGMWLFSDNFLYTLFIVLSTDVNFCMNKIHILNITVYNYIFENYNYDL